MDDEALKATVERMVRQYLKEPPEGTAPPDESVQCVQSAGEMLPDLTEVDLRKHYLVKNPENGEAFLRLKAKTPARIGLGRAGARYRTETMLRLRADHAAAQDSVFSMVPEEWVQRQGWGAVKTLCKDKDEYLTRPDKGRRFDEENAGRVKEILGERPKVALVVGDGLSSAAIEANAPDCMQAIEAGLSAFHIPASPVLFVTYCRVGASDHIGELTGAEAVCMLVGERPGLVTAESMSAYLTYGARLGVPESQRTVNSNIHRQGTPAVEAGAHIAELIRVMLERKASGVKLAQLLREGGVR